MGKFYFITAGILFFVIASCKNGSGEKELTDAEIAIRDSVSKVEQRKKVDSLKKKNPLLIMPPDSTYTGDYTDKYPSGIIKFKGFFRFGKRHGQWMSFYPTGLIWSEMHYDKGLRQGPNIAYYEGGGKRYEGVYKNDERDSVWCYYDSIGNISERVLFKHDKIVQKLPLK